MNAKPGTLEGAGYAYNPFTAADIWGGPTPLAMKGTYKNELMVGADDSAIPHMAAASQWHGAPVHPNSSAHPKAAQPDARQKRQGDDMMYLIIFAAVIGAALYFKAP